MHTTAKLLLQISTSGILILLFLASCIQQNSPTPSYTPTATSTNVTSTQTAPPQATITAQPTSKFNIQAADLKGTPVYFWHPWSGELSAELTRRVRIYNATNPYGIWVEIESWGSRNNLDTMLEEASLSGNLPTLIVSTPEVNTYRYEIERMLVDLSPYVQDPIWGLSAAEIADIPKPFIHTDFNQSPIVSIPVSRDAEVLFYNLSWANELGFADPPATLEEIQQQACQATKKALEDTAPTNMRKGGLLVDIGQTSTYAWLQTSGTDIIDASQKSYNFDTKEVYDTFSFLKGMLEKGCAWVASDGSPQSAFAQRETLLYAGRVRDIPAQMKAMAVSANQADQWTVIPFPGKNGKPIAINDGLSIAVVDSTPNKNMAAWLFLRWMISPEVQTLITMQTYTYPVRLSALSGLVDFQEMNPVWTNALQIIPFSIPAPELSSWIVVQNVLEDAVREIYNPQTTVEQLGGIIQQVDSTAKEIVERYH